MAKYFNINGKTIKFDELGDPIAYCQAIMAQDNSIEFMICNGDKVLPKVKEKKEKSFDFDMSTMGLD